MALLESKIKINIQRIESKIKEPTSIVALEDTDSILLDLGQIIDEINRQIMTNNSIVNDKRKKQEQCRREVWEMIAFLLKDQIADYKAAIAGFERDIKGLEEPLKMPEPIGVASLERSRNSISRVSTPRRPLRASTTCFGIPASRGLN